jgi:hypothetical protein
MIEVAIYIKVYESEVRSVGKILKVYPFKYIKTSGKQSLKYYGIAYIKVSELF